MGLLHDQSWSQIGQLAHIVILFMRRHTIKGKLTSSMLKHLILPYVKMACEKYTNNATKN